MDDPRVQFELTRYLPDNWTPIIEKDVDGPSSLPLRIDGEVPNLGKLSATRRVARTVYLGSAPTAGAAHRGLEDRRVKLGCVMPGESPAVFGDALRRLAGQATYLYQDGARFWYATQPTVTKLAEDRAEQLKRDPDKVAAELEARIRANLKQMGDFARVHPLPRSSADVPDDLAVRLVVLPPEYPYIKEADNAAQVAAQAILEFRGHAPRRYRNTLVFLAADKVRLQDLEEAVRRFLAWRSILDEKVALNLDPHQVRQAETQLQAADSTVDARLPEAYQWLLVPEQKTPQTALEWQALRLTGADALAVRASRKLKGDELLVGKLGGTVLRQHLDAVPLWRGIMFPYASSWKTSQATCTFPGSPGPEFSSSPSATAWSCPVGKLRPTPTPKAGMRPRAGIGGCAAASRFNSHPKTLVWSSRRRWPNSSGRPKFRPNCRSPGGRGLKLPLPGRIPEATAMPATRPGDAPAATPLATALPWHRTP